jgi:hypothetical protein
MGEKTSARVMIAMGILIVIGICWVYQKRDKDFE